MKKKIFTAISAFLLTTSFMGASAITPKVSGGGYTTLGCVIYLDDGNGGTVRINVGC